MELCGSRDPRLQQRALDGHWLDLFLLHICELRVYIKFQDFLLHNTFIVYFLYTEEIQIGNLECCTLVT